MQACGKERFKMPNEIEVTRYRATIGERKDIENTLAGNAKRDAIVDYIAACDYPEVFEGEEGDGIE